MGFHRQEYWSGLQFLTPRDPPDPGIKLGFPALQADSLQSEPLEKCNYHLKEIEKGEETKPKFSIRKKIINNKIR